VRLFSEGKRVTRPSHSTVPEADDILKSDAASGEAEGNSTLASGGRR
jgi:hypothetical protein